MPHLSARRAYATNGTASANSVALDDQADRQYVSPVTDANGESAPYHHADKRQAIETSLRNSNSNDDKSIGEGTWNRGAYPLQSSNGRPTDYSSQLPTLSAEHESMSVRSFASGHSPATDRTLRRTQRSSDLGSLAANGTVQPMTPPLNDNFATSKPVNHSAVLPVLIESASTSQPYSRGSDMDDDTMQNVAPPYPDHQDKREQTSAETAFSHRSAYPLSSSGAAFAVADAPPPMTGKESDKAGIKTSNPSPVPEQEARGRTSLRSRAYPLQAPASYVNLRGSPTPPSSPDMPPEDLAAGSTDQVQGGRKTSANQKTPRRQIYPLQSPASVANLLRPQTPPTSPDEAEDQTKTQQPEIPQSNQNGPKGSKCLRRQIYPLQSQASIPALKVFPPSSPAPPSPVTEDPQEEQHSAAQIRERDLAAKVVKHWRRQVYPVQSPEALSHFERAPTPQPPLGPRRTPGPIHLPKNIRATANAAQSTTEGRTIIVCLDGTGDKFDNDNSNIVHLISALKKDDPRQVTYYQAGIGTYGASGLSSGFEAALDMAVGAGLGLHVRDAYQFLMHSYKEGDKICIFGFSRGAYTARCLAGMVHKVGLLPPRNIQQIPFAYEFYSNDTTQGWKDSQDFKATFCIDVCVYFLGCFDSVASVGFIPRQLPLSSTPNSKPRYFRHAMALDERRAKFKICRHQTKHWDDISLPESPGLPGQEKYGEKNHPNITDEEYKMLMTNGTPFDTDVLEVWFAGDHADIGGGAVANDERHKLAQIPLRWMIRQTFEANTGIIFKTKVLAEFGLDVHTLWPKYERLSAPHHGPAPRILEKYEANLPPKSIRRSKLVPIDKHEDGEPFYHLRSHEDEDWTPEQVEDFYDAMSPLHDQLVVAPVWWILEFWPVQYKVPTAPGEVLIRTGMNLGRYRGIEDREPNLHWTVQHRMQHKGYKIQARTAAHTQWQIVV